MVAQALAAFYGNEFVGFDESVERFNHRLAVTPIIWLDEGGKAVNTARFRSLIGNSLHKIERKGMDPETLEGCLRLVVTANNDDALPMDDVRTIQDVQAVVERVRYIAVPSGEGGAAEYLERGGGKEGMTKFWVTDEDGGPGALCRHIAWLGQQPPALAPGTRFKLHGEPTPWHYRAMYSGAVGAVMSLLAESVVADNVPSARIENGRIWVDPAAFVASYRAGLKAEGVDAHTAKDVLRGVLTERTLEVDGRFLFEVPKALLLDMPRSAYTKQRAYTALHERL
jgi:hypothetical protein